MSTRSNIGFYKDGQKSLERFEMILYRHCDGFPKDVLAEIVPVLKNVIALGGWIPRDAAKMLVDQSEDRIGFSEGIHWDINYFYAVYPDRIEVFKMRIGAKPDVGKDWIKTVQLV